MVFAPGTDIYRARQLVEERLTQAHALPNVSKPPTLLQPLSSSNRVLMIGLSSDKLSAIEQSVIARWTVRPRLMGVPGVANVSVWGMRDQQLQVQVDPARLRDQGVTLSQVINSAGNAQVVSPADLPGGFDAGHRRVHRDPAATAAGPPPAGEDRRPGRAGQGPGRRYRRPTAPRQTSRTSWSTTSHSSETPSSRAARASCSSSRSSPEPSTLEVTEGVEDALETLRPGLVRNPHRHLDIPARAATSRTRSATSGSPSPLAER